MPAMVPGPVKQPVQPLPALTNLPAELAQMSQPATSGEAAPVVMPTVDQAALSKEQENLRVQVRQFLTVQLQKGLLTSDKGKEIALKAKEEIEAAHTTTECAEVIRHLAVKFPESLQGLLLVQEEATSRSAELEIASMVVTWIKEAKLDLAISLAKQAAEEADDVAILKNIKQVLRKK